MSTVLVTGGTGYVGRLALEELALAGVAGVVSIDVRRPTDPVDGVTYLTEDVRSADLAGLCRDHDVGAIVHLAAIVDPPPDMDDQTLRSIDVGGTRRVLAAAIETGVEHVTVTSSGAAYGYHRSNRGRRLTEDDPVRGSTAFTYSRHKAEVERLLARHRLVHPEVGQLVLRPGTILGADTDNQITALFTAPVVVGLRDTDVPFVFVWDRDVAAVIARGVTERTTGVYNLAGDGVVTLREIAAIEHRPYLPLPAELLTGALRVLERFGLTRYGPEQVDFLRYRPVLANDRCKEAFPGLPTKTSAEVYAFHRAARRAR